MPVEVSSLLMSAFRKILVIRGGAIGDFILTLPVLSALRAMFLTTKIEILGYPRIASLALAEGLVDAVHPIESPDLVSFFSRDADLNVKWRIFFEECDLIVSYLFDPEGTFAQNVKRCSKARFITGPHRPDESASRHAMDVFLEPVGQLSIRGFDAAPRLLAFRTGCVGNVVACHPGSGSEKKNWPEKNWANLLQRLVESTNDRLLLIGGEAEGEKFHRLLARLPSERVESAFNLPLTEVARKLAASRFFIGHDSGITHLAAALGLAGVVLWGGSNLNIWRPRSARMKILENPEGLKGITVETVVRSFDRTWRA